MKNIISFLALISISVLCACEQEEPVIPVPEENTSIYWNDFCSVDEIHWLPDNFHIIMSDHCDGTFKKINTLSKSVEYIQIESGYIEKDIFVSGEFADSFFYVGHAYQDNNTIGLFSYNLTTRTTSLIKKGWPYNTKFELHGHRMAISGNPIEIIDLKTGGTSMINANGFPGPFSPEGTKLIISNAPAILIYDFSCDCTTLAPSDIYGKGIIWNNVGLFTFQQTPFDYTTNSSMLLISDFFSGFPLVYLENYAGGPWSANHGTEMLVFTFNPTKTKQEGTLVSFDCINHATRNILTSESDHLVRWIGRKQVSVSPDQTKIAYTELGLSIKVDPLN